MISGELKLQSTLKESIGERSKGIYI